jgi:hypothetical protein
MPKCYLLTLVGGSSLDRYTNNVTLFNLVEQLNFPKERRPPPGAMVPLEIHAYFLLDSEELNQRFEVRYSLVASSGLETLTDIFSHRSSTPRFRTRMVGLPIPPVEGEYQLRVDTRRDESQAWQRQSASWPVIIAETEPRPAVTH